MIGTRILKIDLPGGERDLRILIETPEGSQKNWTCAFEIDWPDAPRRRVARGVDALQAAYIAQQMIGAELYTSQYHAEGRLRWGQPGDGYGFPVPKNIRGMLVGDDRKFEGND